MYKFLSLQIFLLYLIGSSDAQHLAKQRIAPLMHNLIDNTAGDSVDIVATIEDISTLRKAENDVVVIGSFSPAQVYILRIRKSRLQAILSNKQLLFSNILRKPKEELTTGSLDLSANAINLVHNKYASVGGNGIVASVKEQLLDTTDIDIKGRYLNTGVAASVQTSHAAIMATILAGAGNTSSYALGAAPGATVTSSSFEALLPDADSVYQHFGISVQNHSYGTAIENFYGSDAVAYDMSAYGNPYLLHVFSVGNSGTDTSASGNYSGVAQLANLTGSFKMAKNIITVGNIDSFKNVLPLSSKGPAYDGRVKPELTAFGQDGSSGAAALVSGSTALLQDFYKQFHNNIYPNASFIKAVLLNSADDIGVKNIDYATGYGCLNAYKAIKTIEGNHFFEDTVSNNGIKTFFLTIPDNTAELKITLAWADTPAIVNADKALINDLDLSIQSPNGETWLPWVLSSYPSADSLLSPAVRKKDTLNNAEQITLDAPKPGIYKIMIKGAKVVTVRQPFSIAYQIDTANTFLFTYPTSSDVLQAGSRCMLRWQTNITGTAAIDYSLDNTSWHSITATADFSKQFYQWNIPQTITTARLRIKPSSVNKIYLSDTFVISPSLKINTGFNCNDSFMLYWNNLQVLQYQLFQLGDKYLTPVLKITDTLNVFKKTIYPSLYYAAAPVINGKTGLHSFTINYSMQGVGCYLESFLATLQSDNTALLTAALGTVYGVDSVTFQKITSSGYRSLQTFSALTTTTFHITDPVLQQGVNQYRFIVTLKNGRVLYSDLQTVYYFPTAPVIIYPNPARQSSPVNIIVTYPGIFSVKIYDASGRYMFAQQLTDTNNTIKQFILPKGIYFVEIFSDSARLKTQKLIVY